MPPIEDIQALDDACTRWRHADFHSEMEAEHHRMNHAIIDAAIATMIAAQWHHFARAVSIANRSVIATMIAAQRHHFARAISIANA